MLTPRPPEVPSNLTSFFSSDPPRPSSVQNEENNIPISGLSAEMVQSTHDETSHISSASFSVRGQQRPNLTSSRGSILTSSQDNASPLLGAQSEDFSTPEVSASTALARPSLEEHDTRSTSNPARPTSETHTYSMNGRTQRGHLTNSITSALENSTLPLDMRDLLRRHRVTETHADNTSIADQASGAEIPRSEFFRTLLPCICSVCTEPVTGQQLEKGQAGSTICNHFFHWNCINKWVNGSRMEGSKLCPNCRRELCNP